MPFDVPDPIRDLAELDALFATPAAPSIRKVTPRLTPAYRQMIQASPFFVIATTGPRGLDCSPRGDAAGFVRIHDDSALLLPERRGNNRIDTLRNLLSDSRAGLLFLVPGISEILRVNGRAHLSRNVQLCESFSVNGSAPKIVIVFQIDTVMFQCARAIVRSQLWDPAKFKAPGDVPSAGTMLADATAGEVGGAAYDAQLSERIRTTLY
ncbi:pyridoxamine 5'-phosphate oxidase family protein [uncultured Paludibaculum sp.]|uniref:pyridoxamine 5'-phosphate oxidase family protein n=1 Tax=uncultured Paludibaculum sp. TaxID=1765020 RepID=UPI002AAB04C3|nr:pyridoxamine 5'-phosphate oxidase family protein [uncultured Paludibaculum sp.]